MITSDRLHGIVPDVVLSQIDDTAQKFNITTNLRLCHFLAQCEHESGGFRWVHENLYYTADGLLKIFPHYFDATSAATYAHQPVMIANRVYANRMGNGDEASGDGYKYCGKGYIQLTGKNNYTKFTAFIGEDCVANPDLVASKYPLSSAAFFFNSSGLWPVCDLGSDLNAVTLVTKRVNGGTIGLDDRWRLFQKYFSILGVAIVPVVASSNTTLCGQV